MESGHASTQESARPRGRDLAWSLPPAFALGSAVSFLARNAAEVRASDVWLPLAFAAAVSLVLTLAGRALVRDAVRAALLASLATALFFSAGVWLALSPRPVVYAGSAVALVSAYVALRRARSAPRGLFRVVRAMGMAFLASSLAYAAYASFAARPAARASEGPDAAPAAESGGAGPRGLPDIYYLVLDAYAREDVLEEAAGFANRDFVERLESNGFFVAGESNSNYAVTQLCLASSLNMDYVDALVPTDGDSPSRPELRPLVEAPRVVEELRARGYTYVSVDSGWGFTSGCPVADVDLRPSRERHVALEFLRTTLLEYWAERYNVVDKRRHVLETFSLLSDVDACGEGPFFVFAHVLMPHRPYVFGRDGEAVSREMWGSMAGREGPHGMEPYVDQLVYTNVLVEGLIEDLMRDRERPLVLVIQGDHGLRSRRPDEPDLPEEVVIRERHAILNACYYSEGPVEGLYQSISPVNTLRVVLDEALGTDRGPLDDRSFYSAHLLDEDRPWEEIFEVTGIVDEEG